MLNQRQHIRLPIEGPGKLAMTIIPFETREKLDIAADAIDRGAGGMGIITDRALAPGFVVIHDGMGESKSGVLVWMMERRDRSYRAGIQFVPTNEKESEHLQNKTSSGLALPALQDPELFASLIMDVVERLEGRRGIGSRQA